jgi:DNA-binding MarR family transcriptional regulator
MVNKKDSINKIFLPLQRILYMRTLLEERPIFFGDVKLTPKEIHTIEVIGKKRNINIKEVGDYFGVTKSAASQMVKKLTRKSLIKKINPPDNNKEFQLTLTSAGKKAFAVHERFHAEHAEELLDKLCKFSLKEIEAAAGILEVIEETVEKRMTGI